MIQPERQSKNLLGITRAKAKMYEYEVPLENHIDISATPLVNLIDLTIAMLGDLTASHESIDFTEERYKFIFSARYFDSLTNTETVDNGTDYLRLLASASYYLGGYLGSSKVVVRLIKHEILVAFGLLAKVLAFVLARKKIVIADFAQYEFINELTPILLDWNTFLRDGSAAVFATVSVLRKKIYADGNDRDLLLIDVLNTVISKIANSSSWKLLPMYSGLDVEIWRPYLSRYSSIKELWPSQILLGEKDIFRGISGIIQMPTSAGKTRASEIVIRSSFLSERSTLVVIVAPFRALCQEIYNELTYQFSSDTDVSINIVSDVLQEDLTDIPENKKSILVLTPEKFDYILRHEPELSKKIGLIIYDEGHLFDDTTRGLKYELLLASLRNHLLPETQVLLISAVMSNANEIKEWLLGDKGVLVEGKNLSPTNRNIAFSSWIRQRGELNFVEEEDIESPLFFVPRVLESYDLELRGGEKTRRIFPAKNDDESAYKSNHVAMYLACKLSSQGLTAVFTGRKDSALVMTRDLLDAYDRGLVLAKPIDNTAYLPEARKLISYIERTLGSDSTQAKASRLGILIHHGSTPHGLRLSIEFALQKLHFRSVICTSTLAQGVNLPIKYLIVSTSRQAGEKIKVRDFHNLIGRAGRSGFYTEGTIIFSDPKIYDRRASEPWHWSDSKKLIDARNSESCRSRLLSIFDPEPEDSKKLKSWQSEQTRIKDEVNSYLLNALAEIEDMEELENIIKDLVKNTLAYYQATDQQKSALVDFFLSIGSQILTSEPDVERRKIFARSVLSLDQSQKLLRFLESESIFLEISDDEIEILEQVWSFIYDNYENKILRSFSVTDALEICKRWLTGESFSLIYAHGKTLKYDGHTDLVLDRIVDLCENVFGYSLSLIIGSMSEVYSLVGSDDESIEKMKTVFYKLQKRMKYGLPSGMSIFIYEMGLSDRQLCLEINERIDLEDGMYSTVEIIEKIAENKDLQNYISENFPAYFNEKIRRLILSTVPF